MFEPELILLNGDQKNITSILADVFLYPPPVSTMVGGSVFKVEELCLLPMDLKSSDSLKYQFHI